MCNDQFDILTCAAACLMPISIVFTYRLNLLWGGLLISWISSLPIPSALHWQCLYNLHPMIGILFLESSHDLSAESTKDKVKRPQTRRGPQISSLREEMLQGMVKSRCEERKEENGELSMERLDEKAKIKTTSVGLLYSIEDTPPWSIYLSIWFYNLYEFRIARVSLLLLQSPQS